MGRTFLPQAYPLWAVAVGRDREGGSKGPFVALVVGWMFDDGGAVPILLDGPNGYVFPVGPPDTGIYMTREEAEAESARRSRRPF